MQSCAASCLAICLLQLLAYSFTSTSVLWPHDSSGQEKCSIFTPVCLLQLVAYNFTSMSMLWPALTGGACAATLVALKHAGRLHPEAVGFWDRNGTSLAATCVFMLEGLADLVSALWCTHKQRRYLCHQVC